MCIFLFHKRRINYFLGGVREGMLFLLLLLWCVCVSVIVKNSSVVEKTKIFMYFRSQSDSASVIAVP